MSSALAVSTVTELPTVYAKDKDGKPVAIRSYSLSLNGVTVEVCSVGASITKLIIPSFAPSSCSGGTSSSTSDEHVDKNPNDDNCVLGYDSPLSMYQTKNPPYFGVIVGRVANRIANGKFQMANDESEEKVLHYNLDINNGPNHLHGGLDGFSHRVWDGAIIDFPPESTGNDDDKETKTQPRQGVQFTLASPDGDQGYPGSVLVTATYTLVPTSTSTMKNTGAVLQLEMRATLLSGSNSPINLAQHSYFNLNRHDAPNGIRDHILMLPSEYYTPSDANLIPTREVRKVKNDPCMDFRSPKTLRDALIQFGTEQMSLDEAKAKENVDLAHGKNIPGEPYGFDHNYVILRKEKTKEEEDSKKKEQLDLAAVLQHPPTQRQMKVYTNAPGLQVYSGNFLDGNGIQLSEHNVCKDDAKYGRWQSLCLETQHFPDSILTKKEEEKNQEFAKGKCFILKPGGKEYLHRVEYHFEPMVQREE